eukprot:TRINITY_DN708_c0_g1_i2.p2 TRINITY_DN708_c0_g1~~TRINITY_DN708_c0_g1_i2.p2  ORF type:complete len:191 (+),score=23.61 TRINITY_DN708_c0_g1_i2:344-916(+)
MRVAHPTNRCLRCAWWSSRWGRPRWHRASSRWWSTPTVTPRKKVAQRPSIEREQRRLAGGAGRGDDDNDGDESQDEDEGPTQAGPYWEHSPKSVRDIPIHWGDEAPAPAESAPAISELDPDMDMDWQPSGATAAAASDHPSPVRFRWPGAGGERHAGGSSESQPELGRRDRERSFPRSWFPHLDRKGPSR